MHQDMQVASKNQYQLVPLVHQSHPWLLFCHGKDKQRQTFFSISKDEYYVRIIPKMRGKVPCSSSYGWLVMYDIQSDECFLLNPISLETIPLPFLDFDYTLCILSLPPTDPNCQILFLAFNCFMSCHPGDNEFVKKEYQIEVDDEDTYLESEIEESEFEDEEFQYDDEESYIENEDEELEFEDEEFQYDDEESYMENENEEPGFEDGEFQYDNEEINRELEFKNEKFQYDDEESYIENGNEELGYEDEEFQYDNEEINEELEFEFQHDDEEIYIEDENEELGAEDEEFQYDNGEIYLENENEEIELEDDEVHHGHRHNYLGNAIFFEGKIYGETLIGHKLVVADFEGSSIQFQPLIWEERTLPRRLQRYLMESHGELLIVHKIYSNYSRWYEEGIDFEIFRMDFTNMELVEVRNIGERSIFLERYTGRCCDVVETGIRKNSIYFIESKDKYLYVFDIEEHSISISLPCPIVSTCNSSLSWIEL